MRTGRHNSKRKTPADRRIITARAVAQVAIALAAASLSGCGDADAKKPAAGSVHASPNGTSTTIARFADGTDAGAAVNVAAFTRDAGSRLLDDHLAPPQYVPIEPPLVAEPVERPKSKVETANLEQLWQPPATPAEPRVLTGERALKLRSLPLRDLPPLAASVAALPLAPGLQAGPLLLAASNDAEDAGELPVSQAAPDVPVIGDPASAPARMAANPVVAAGREGPAPFMSVNIPSPQDRDHPVLPVMAAPPADADVYPAAGGRLLWSPVLPVPAAK